MSSFLSETAGLRHLQLADDLRLVYTRMDLRDSTQYLPFLQPSETDKANRLRDASRAGYALISRGILRLVLGEELQMPPLDVPIVIEENGKPVLADSCNKSLFFNVSHSGGVLVIAVSRSMPVGVDIEFIDPCLNPGQVSSLAFSVDERDILRSMGFSHSTFYKIWTAKEALLKATGSGFSYPTNTFSVMSSETSCLMPSISGEVTKGRSCTFHPFSLFREFAGTLAAIHPQNQILRGFDSPHPSKFQLAGLRQQ